MHWQTQDENITTNFKVKVGFMLPALSATNVVTSRCHVDDSARGRHDMNLDRYLLTELLLNSKISEHVIKAYYDPFIGSTSPMVDLVAYVFKDLNTREIKPGESFTDAYVKEVYESEHVFTATKQLHVVLDAKY